jgi:MFS family permease
MTTAHPTRTLWLIGALHAFTHAYNVALLPLYLAIQRDFQLASLAQATFLVTAMMMAYIGPSFFQGVLADRLNRKRLLEVGLTINALGFVGLSFAPNYAIALLCVIVAGLGGSFFHPAATSMVAHVFPENKGRALGLIGIGASVGFFCGALYAGWRAQTSGWRAPVLELGSAGLVFAGLFAWLAEDDPATKAEANRPAAHGERLFPTPVLWVFFLGACVAFSLRDFAGSSMGSLGSLFLQRAQHFDLQTTGLTLSCIFLASAISNPLFGQLSDRGRSRWLAVVLVLSAAWVAAFPHLPRAGLVPGLLLYGFFFMASYPIVEAALMESVPAAVRGRVFGLFITIGGLVGNSAHWLAGRWVQRLGDAANAPEGYSRLYVGLAALMVCSLAGLPCLRAMRRREHLENISDRRAPGPQPRAGAMLEPTATPSCSEGPAPRGPRTSAGSLGDGDSRNSSLRNMAGEPAAAPSSE